MLQAGTCHYGQTLADGKNLLLLGHGFMNRMIAKRLELAGWIRHESSGSRYWSASTYRIDPRQKSPNSKTPG